MNEEIYEYLNNFGFTSEELTAFNKENEKLYFASLKNVTDNIEFLEAKGLNQKEIIEVIKKDTFMLTASTKKKKLLDEIYKEIFKNDEIKETIIKYPDMYIVSPVELQEVINYIKSKNLNPREIIISDLNVLSFNLEDVKNKM